MTLSQKFKSLRESKGLSLQDVHKQCGRSPARQTIWKVEQGLIPSGKVFKKVCLRGLGLSEKSEDWQELQALWVAAKTGEKVSAQELTSNLASQLTKGNAQLESFVKKVARLDPDSFTELMKAVERPAVLEGIAVLNRLYEKKA